MFEHYKEIERVRRKCNGTIILNSYLSGPSDQITRIFRANDVTIQGRNVHCSASLLFDECRDIRLYNMNFIDSYLEFKRCSYSYRKTAVHRCFFTSFRNNYTNETFLDPKFDPKTITIQEKGIVMSEGCSGIEIKNSRFENLDAAIVNNGGSTSKFEDNKIERCFKGIFEKGNSATEMKNNNIGFCYAATNNNGTKGFKLDKDNNIGQNKVGMIFENIENMTIKEHSTCSNNEENGVVIRNCKNLELIRFEISNNKKHGVLVENSDNIRIGAVIKNNMKNGVYMINTHNGMISGSTIENNNWEGILLEKCNNNVISGNTLNDNGFCNIHIKNSHDNKFTANKLIKSSYGIFGDKSNNTDFSGMNKIDDHKVYGIYFKDSKNTKIYTNEFINCSIGFKMLNCIGLEFVNNKLHEIKKIGIDIDNSRNSRINSNQIYNSFIGIYINHDSNMVELVDNKIYKCNSISSDPIYYFNDELKNYKINPELLRTYKNSRNLNEYKELSEICNVALLINNSYNNKISACYIYENKYGIILKNTKKNIIRNSYIYDNENEGILFSNNSCNNLIQTNNIFDNKNNIFISGYEGSCSLLTCKDNMISGNKFYNTKSGCKDIIAAEGSTLNIIYDNELSYVETSNKSNDIFRIVMTKEQQDGYKKECIKNETDIDIISNQATVVPVKPVKVKFFNKEEDLNFNFDISFFSSKIKFFDNISSQLDKIDTGINKVQDAINQVDNIKSKTLNNLNNVTQKVTNQIDNISNFAKKAEQVSNFVSDIKSNNKTSDISKNIQRSKDVEKPKEQKKSGYLSGEKAQAGQRKVLGKIEEIVRNIGEPVAAIKDIVDTADNLGDLVKNADYTKDKQNPEKINALLKKLNKTYRGGGGSRGASNFGNSLPDTSNLGSLVPSNVSNMLNIANKFLSKGNSIKNKIDSILGLANSIVGKFDKGKGKNDLEFFKKNQKGKADGENPDRAINELNELKDKKAKAKVDNILPPNKEKFEFILDNSVDQEPIKKSQEEITKVLDQYKRKIGDIKSVLGDTLENIENVKQSALMKLGFNTIGNNESLSGLSSFDVGGKLGSIGKEVGKALNKFNEFKDKINGIKDKAQNLLDKADQVIDFVKDPKGIINDLKNEILAQIKENIKDVGNKLIQDSIGKINKNAAGLLGTAVDNFVKSDFNLKELKDTVNNGIKGFTDEVVNIKDKYLSNFKEEIVDNLANTSLYNAQEEINLDKFSKKANKFLNNNLRSVRESLEKIKETSDELYHKVKSRKLMVDIDEIKLNTDKNVKYIFDDNINKVKNNILDFKEEIAKDAKFALDTTLSNNFNNQVKKLEKNIEKINEAKSTNDSLEAWKKSYISNTPLINGNIFSDGNNNVCNEQYTQERHFIQQSFGNFVDQT